MKKEKIKFATLQDLVEWLELSKHDNIEVRDFGEYDWMSAKDALVEYRDILHSASDDMIECFNDTELEVKEFRNPVEDDEYDNLEDAREARKKYGGLSELIVREPDVVTGKPIYRIYSVDAMSELLWEYGENDVLEAFREAKDGIDYDDFKALAKKHAEAAGRD